MKELNSVQKFYKDKTIFITGASGFMGKVLIEKLLYSCSDLKEIIILMRPKRGKTGKERVDEFSKLPLFKRIMDTNPDILQKIFPVWGEITQPNLGLSDEHLNHILENTEIVFHLAASLKLEATLKPNIIMNLTGTKNVVDVSKRIKNLIQMVHTSTAFCNVEFDVLEEKVNDFPHEPLDLINLAGWLSEDAMATIQKDLLGVHPNTYTYTKRLAEILVRNEFEKSNLPACIVRPSIVTPSYQEPIPGWVDSLNGPPGVIMASGKGALRCILLNKEANFESIPVDLAINGLIMIVKKLCTQPTKSKEIPVFNVTMHELVRMTYGRFFDLSVAMKDETPCSVSLWYPNVTLTLNKFYYLINIILFQWIPAIFIDFLLLIFGQKRFMIHVQKKIAIGMDVLKCFTMNNWNFRSNNFRDLVEIQSKEEYDMFFVDSRQIDSEQMVRQAIIGGRVYCLKDPLSTVPKAKRLLKIQYVIDKLVKYLFFYWVFKKILVYSGIWDPNYGVLDIVSGIFHN
ncbi:putative fatty acyl-CoA reductase CG5065 [Chironomus tepperi]|uniref:putative fatty acyl-CoA reductase CG5065 n=1 Tax=Chironomus tepperi TaxID=113505 RepID=UPI00391EFB36